MVCVDILAKFRLTDGGNIPKNQTGTQICTRYELRNRFQGIASAILCSLSSRHDMPICRTGRQAT
jgi:hypothetical protein